MAHIVGCHEQVACFVAASLESYSLTRTSGATKTNELVENDAGVAMMTPRAYLRVTEAAGMADTRLKKHGDALTMFRSDQTVTIDRFMPESPHRRI